jgi:hypothetical protein
MGDCISPSAASDFANKDVNRIVGKIAQVLARKSPYMDILDGGTLENVSDVVRSIVPERAVLGTSLATPTFRNDIEMCAGPVNQDAVGSTEYSYQLQSLRGQGPRVCVKTSRAAFKGSYLAAQQSLEKGILQIMNSDIRNVLRARSGVKFVVNTNFGFGTLLTGEAQAINTPFYNALPNAPLSFKIVYKLGQFLREEMLADPYTTNGMGEMFKFIGSPEIIERFRQDLDIKEDLRALATGTYKLGEKSIAGYQFEGPYRGVGFGYDSQPLRFATMTNGVPNFIEPEISTVVTRGVAARRNPAWVTAPYEIAFLVAPMSFIRLVPEQYLGEGTFKFNPQLSMGELTWHYQRDNDCNMFGDFGQHIYQIARAYQPVRPQNVIPIAYQRCAFDLGTSACSSSAAGL